MSNNLSEGPIQVVENDVLSINDALRQVGERLDKIKGLRGRTVIHDRVAVNEPVVSGDAVNLGSQTGAISTFSSISLGTTLTLNPYAVSTTTTQAHGLSAEPFYVKLVLECLTAELGYVAGERILLSNSLSDSASGRGITMTVDATNVVVITEASVIQITRADTYAQTSITAANWKLLAYPYTVS